MPTIIRHGIHACGRRLLVFVGAAEGGLKAGGSGAPGGCYRALRKASGLKNFLCVWCWLSRCFDCSVGWWVWNWIVKIWVCVAMVCSKLIQRCIFLVRVVFVSVLLLAKNRRIIVMCV